MDKTFGYLILIGLAIGVFFGLSLAPAIGNTLLSIGFGALAGVFFAWFVAAAIQENRKG
jgi:hypothetical protein